MALVLFASAGSVRFWEGWTYLGIHLVGLAGTSLYLLAKNPALLERRLALEERGETERVQRLVIGASRLTGVAVLLIAGVDHNRGWSQVPPAAIAVADATFVAGTLLVFAVLRANSFTSSVIEVAPRQTVVTIGPYRVARHPFYAGTLLMGVATPFSLGSYWAAVLLLPSIALLVVRILAEERFLTEHLPGYREYLVQTRSRLVPGIW